MGAWKAEMTDEPLFPAALYVMAANHPQHQRKDTLAVDFNFTDKQRLQFRRRLFTSIARAHARHDSRAPNRARIRTRLDTSSATRIIRPRAQVAELADALL